MASPASNQTLNKAANLANKIVGGWGRGEYYKQ